MTAVAAEHGLAAMHAQLFPDVAVTGYTSVAGLSWYAPSSRASHPQLTTVELVTTDAKVTEADADNHPTSSRPCTAAEATSVSSRR